MRKTCETMGSTTYLLRHVSVFCITVFLYRYVMFRTPIFLTHTTAWYLLIAIMGVVLTTGILYTYKRQRTWWELTVTFLIGYGLVTSVLYFDVFRKHVLFCIMLGLMLSIIFCVCGTIRSLTYHKRRTNLFREGMRKLLPGSFRYGMAIAFLAFLCVVSYRRLLVGSLLNAEMYMDVSEEETMLFVQDVEVMMQMDVTEWNLIDWQTRLNMLGMVASVEGRRLGLQGAVALEAADLSENVGRSYRRNERVIRLNIRYLNLPPQILINTVCHEMYHAYQWEQAESKVGLGKSWEDVKGNASMLWSEAAYIRGEDDFENYYNQRIEAEAREYAEKRVREYL